MHITLVNMDLIPEQKIAEIAEMVPRTLQYFDSVCNTYFIRVVLCFCFYLIFLIIYILYK